MRRPLLEDDFFESEHLKDHLEVVVDVPGEYDPDTGEWGEPTEKTTWSGMGSIQPYIRTSLTAVQPPTGGVALAIDAFKIYVPHEALERGQGKFKIRSGTRYFEPKHDPLDPGGQRDYWVVIAAELNRGEASA